MNLYRFKHFLALSMLVLFQCAHAGVDALPNWTRTNPGGGGAISTVGATSSGILLAASDLSGVYRSFDKGKSWDVLGANNGLLETHTSAFGFHAKDGNIFMVGTGRGVYKTVDGGDTFYQAKMETVRAPEPDGTNKADGYIESIGMSLSNPSIGYLAHYEDWKPELTFMKTTDAGDSWKIVKTKGIPARSRVIKILVDRKKSKIVYALTGKARFGCGPAELYQSRNGGKKWVRIGAGLGDILDIDLHPRRSNKIYVSTFEANPCGVDEEGNPIDYVDGEGSMENYLAGDEYSGDFYVSKNGGKSFTWLSDQTGIISVDNKRPRIICLVDILYPYDWNDNAGTWTTRNGGKSWSHTGLVKDWNVGFSGNQYYSFSPSFSGLSKTLTKDQFNSNNLYASFGQWAWATFDGGKHLNNISTKKTTVGHWISTGVENINGHALDINDKNRNIVYMGGYDIGFWYSKNHGASWTRSLPDYNKYPNFVWDMGEKPVDSYAAKRGGGANVNTILSDPARENVVWASFSRDQYQGEIDSRVFSAGLFKSNRYGENWHLSGKGLPGGAESVRVYGLSLDYNSPVNKRTLYVTVAGDVYQSRNDGSSWNKVLSSDISGGLKFTQVDRFNGNLVYAGGEGGLWRSLNAGKNWTQVGGIYKSEMQGNHASMRNDIIPTEDETDYSSEEEFISLHAWEGVFDIKTDPNVTGRVYVTAYGKDKGLYRSDNAGLDWTKLMTDSDMRGVAIAPANSSIVYVTSSQSYYSGGKGNSLGVQFSDDAGTTWQDANQGMAWSYAGMIDIESGDQPNVWVWSPGTGVQYSSVPLHDNTDSDGDTMTNQNEDLNGVNKNNRSILSWFHLLNATIK